MKKLFWLSALILVSSLSFAHPHEGDSLHLPDYDVLAKAQAVLAKGAPKNVVDARKKAEDDDYHVMSKQLVDLGSVEGERETHLHRALYVEVWHKHGDKNHPHGKDGARVITAVVTVDHHGKVGFVSEFSLPEQSNKAPVQK